MTKAKHAQRAIQRFMIEFRGPLPGEAEPVTDWELQEFLCFAIEAARHNGMPQATESLFYARIGKLVIRPLDIDR